MSISSLLGYRPAMGPAANYRLDAATPASGGATRQVGGKITYGVDIKEQLPVESVSDIKDDLLAALKKLLDSPETSQMLRELIQWLMKMLFPDVDRSPGGVGRRVDRDMNKFPPGESMSNKPLSEGAQYANYRPDNTDPGKKPENVWSGFSQGSEGNCVTVSAIKAAMMRFGQKPTDIYQDVKETGNGYDVTMRDGFQLHLSKGELQQAAREARFKDDDPSMMTDANFMYGVSAKRAQMENNDGSAGRSYSAALNSLNDGEVSREGLQRLGLKNYIRQGTQADLANGVLGTLERDAHSMAVIGGREEVYGTRGGYPKPGIVTLLV